MNKLRIITRRVILVLGSLAGVERLYQASKSFQQWRFSLRIGDASGAEGWKTFMTVQLIESALFVGLALGVFLRLKSAPADR